MISNLELKFSNKTTNKSHGFTFGQASKSNKEVTTTITGDVFERRIPTKATGSMNSRFLCGPIQCQSWHNKSGTSSVGYRDPIVFESTTPHKKETTV